MEDRCRWVNWCWRVEEPRGVDGALLLERGSEKVTHSRIPWLPPEWAPFKLQYKQPWPPWSIIIIINTRGLCLCYLFSVCFSWSCLGWQPGFLYNCYCSFYANWWIPIMFLVVLFFQCIVSYTQFSLNLILAFFASYYWGINECQLAACALVAMKHTAGPVLGCNCWLWRHQDCWSYTMFFPRVFPLDDVNSCFFLVFEWCQRRPFQQELFGEHKLCSPVFVLEHKLCSTVFVLPYLSHDDKTISQSLCDNALSSRQPLYNVW